MSALASFALSIMLTLLSAVGCLGFSGQPLWRFDAGSGVTTGVTVRDGAAYFGDEYGTVHAVGADGAELWNYSLNCTVVGVTAASGDAAVAATSDGKIAALNRRTGELMWLCTPMGREEGSGTFSDGVAVGDGMIFVSGGDAVFYALGLSDGAARWTWNASIPLITAGTYHAGTVYVGDQNGRMTALDASTGKRLWGGGGAGAVHTPAVTGEYAYFSCSGGSVNCVRLKDKRTIWSSNAGIPLSTSPVVSGGKVFVGTAGGSVVALNASSGGVIWSSSIGGGNVNAHPVTGGGLLFVGGGQGTLFALDIETGGVRWSYDMGGEMLGSACFADGVLYAASAAGQLTAFK